MRNFRNLEIWKRGMNISKEIYLITQNFPKEEKFGLQSQIRRAVTSIPINIAEGCGRIIATDFANFLRYSEGSACEVETELLLAASLGYLSQESAEALISELQEIQKMISAYRLKLKEGE